MSATVYVCPHCGQGSRRPVVPAGALTDARAEIERLGEAAANLIRAWNRGPDEAAVDAAAVALQAVLDAPR